MAAQHPLETLFCQGFQRGAANFLLLHLPNNLPHNPQNPDRSGSDRGFVVQAVFARKPLFFDMLWASEKGTSNSFLALNNSVLEVQNVNILRETIEVSKTSMITKRGGRSYIKIAPLFL